MDHSVCQVARRCHCHVNLLAQCAAQATVPSPPALAPTQVAYLLLPVLLAAASAAQLAAAACSAQNVSGEAACPSCNLCYATEAAALTLELAQNAYDSAANITTFSFLVGVSADGVAGKVAARHTSRAGYLAGTKQYARLS